MSPAAKAVLLVEDEAELRQLFKLLLEAENLEVLSTGEGVEALRLLDERKEGIGVIVTDMNLPGADGPTIVAHARARYPSIRILAMSGFGGAEMMQTAEVAGVDEFINKPFNPMTAIATVHRLLGGG
jgi:two-component system cell cycle sensor histidine kinase/response regulator CckA